MRITKQMLKQIIKEELNEVVYENEAEAAELGQVEYAVEDDDTEETDIRSYTIDEVGSMVEDLVEMVSSAPWAAGGAEGLSEAKPKYISGKSAKERMHGKDKPKKSSKPTKTDAEKKLEDLNKRIARYQKNIDDKKDVEKNKTLLKRVQREKKRLAGF